MTAPPQIWLEFVTLEIMRIKNVSRCSCLLADTNVSKAYLPNPYSDTLHLSRRSVFLNKDGRSVFSFSSTEQTGKMLLASGAVDQEAELRNRVLSPEQDSAVSYVIRK